MSDKKFIKWILTYGYRQAKRESDQGNLSIAGVLVISQIVFWVAAIIFSPLFIFLYALGWIVKLLDRRAINHNEIRDEHTEESE